MSSSGKGSLAAKALNGKLTARNNASVIVRIPSLRAGLSQEAKLTLQGPYRVPIEPTNYFSAFDYDLTVTGTAARRASGTPLQTRFSPTCNSDCTRICASAGVQVSVLSPCFQC